MLANFSNLPISGALGTNVHQPATYRHELVAFVASELPRWRDRPDRVKETAEINLTSQLCAHLNGAARHATGWDNLQFRTETPDEQQKARKIDLVVSPCGVTLWIEGRRHSEFDSLLPVECKRLPTPNDKNRDEREYVISKYSSTGGIQRFKEGHHGAAHTLGAMIGYVQEKNTTHWQQQVARWIGDLTTSGETGWSSTDQLQLESDDRTLRMTAFISTHVRKTGTPIELRHLWLELN